MTVTWFDGATLEVSVALGYGPSNDLTAASWTDITAYVREVIDISTGRSAELDTFQAGMVGVVLDNRDRRFDPDYSGSPHFPQLKVNTPLRVRLTYSASTSYLGMGFVSGWTQGWHVSDNDAVARIVAFDWLKYAARTALPESIWYVDIQAQSPHVWYRLGETDDSAKAINATSIAGASLRDGTYAGVGRLAAGLTYAAGNGSRTVAARDSWSYSPIVRAAGIGNSFSAKTIIAWITCPVAPTTGTTQWIWMQSTYGVTWDNGLGPGESTPADPLEPSPRLLWGLNSSTKKFIVKLFDSSVTGVVESASVSHIFDGLPHMIALTRTGSSINFYVDGVLFSGSLTSGSLSSTATTFGPVLDVGVFRGEAYTLDEVAYWDSTDLSSSMADLYAAGADGHSGDTVDERLNRVLDGTIYATAAVLVDVPWYRAWNVSVPSAATNTRPPSVVPMRDR